MTLMGGVVDVKSEPGVGTTFCFTIKSKIGVKTSRTYMNLDGSDVENKHILVVDDNLTNRNILETQLKQWKFIPSIAESGKQAIELLYSNKQIELVISDMNMPEMDGVQLAGKIKENWPEIPIILLSSMGNEQSRDQAHLFNVILTKPTKHLILYKHILNQLKNVSGSKNDDLQPDRTQFYTALSDKYPMDILIAEDNLVNQKVAIRTLSKMGYTPDLAANGREVLNAMDNKNYNLIFMDMQMPEMDGLEATRLIRQRSEKQPFIVAMTANAMSEDRELCMNAGMDDYLSKPIKLTEIMKVIEKWGKEVNMPADLV